LSDLALGILKLEETRVYASYEPSHERNLRSWLLNFLDRQPGIRVFTVERHWREQPVHCRFCGRHVKECSHCGQPLGRAAEKRVDALIVTDMMSLAWEDAYDVALLVSSDRDFIPAVEKVQSKNLKVINASWQGYGHELARISWASFNLDPLLPALLRSCNSD
jgi:uncharacterized LabA/DUF88 family protein